MAEASQEIHGHYPFVLSPLHYEYAPLIHRQTLDNTAWEDIFQKLDNDLELKLSETDRQTLALLYTVFQGAKRSGKEVFIPDYLKDNSAQHSINAALEAKALFDKNHYGTPEERKEIYLKILLHDLGEILRELSTNGSKQSDNVDKTEREDIEGRLAELAIVEAQQAIHAGTEAKQAFIEKYTGWQHEANGFDSLHFAAYFIKNNVDSAYAATDIPSQAEPGSLLQMLREVEGMGGHNATFADKFAKLVEKYQGASWQIYPNSLREVNFGNGTLSNRQAYATSATAQALHENCFRHLPATAKLAKTETQKQLVLDYLDSSYDLMLEAVNLGPGLINFHQGWGKEATRITHTGEPDYQQIVAKNAEQEIIALLKFKRHQLSNDHSRATRFFPPETDFTPSNEIEKIEGPVYTQAEMRALLRALKHHKAIPGDKYSPLCIRETSTRKHVMDIEGRRIDISEIRKTAEEFLEKERKGELAADSAKTPIGQRRRFVEELRFSQAVSQLAGEYASAALMKNSFADILAAGTQPNRYYHNFSHFTDIAGEGGITNEWRAVRYLAGMHHDIVYHQVDRSAANPEGFAPGVKEIIAPFLEQQESAFIIAASDDIPTEDQPIFNALLTLFGFQSGDTLSPYAGQNEFLSAVYAMKQCQALGIPDKYILAEMAHIQATVPFGPQDHFVALRNRLEQANNLLGDNQRLLPEDISSIIASAAAMANADVKGFSGDFNSFIAGTYQLMAESKGGLAALDNPATFTEAVKGQIKFLSGLNTDITSGKRCLYHSADGTPSSEIKALEAKAQENITHAVTYLQAHLVAATLLASATEENSLQYSAQRTHTLQFLQPQEGITSDAIIGIAHHPLPTAPLAGYLLKTLRVDQIQAFANDIMQHNGLATETASTIWQQLKTQKAGRVIEATLAEPQSETTVPSSKHHFKAAAYRS